MGFLTSSLTRSAPASWQATVSTSWPAPTNITRDNFDPAFGNKGFFPISILGDDGCIGLKLPIERELALNSTDLNQAKESSG